MMLTAGAGYVIHRMGVKERVKDLVEERYHIVRGNMFVVAVKDLNMSSLFSLKKNLF